MSRFHCCNLCDSSWCAVHQVCVIASERKRNGKVWTTEELGGYQHLFNAIADAIKPYSDKSTGISVEKFIQALNKERVSNDHTV